RSRRPTPTRRGSRGASPCPPRGRSGGLRLFGARCNTRAGARPECGRSCCRSCPPRAGTRRSRVELRALERVLQRVVERRLRDADAAGRRLDARALEGAHELLEARAFFAAKEGVMRDLELVEG